MRTPMVSIARALGAAIARNLGLHAGQCRSGRMAATMMVGAAISVTGLGLTGTSPVVAVTIGHIGAVAPPSVPLEAGAAVANITPPAYTVASDQAFVPTCGSSATQVAALWPGRRLFAFEEPYVPLINPQLGEYVVGDPYCDANHAGHYQAPYVAGPPGQDHWPTSVQKGNPLQAVAVVYALGTKRVATVAVDSIGLFNVTMDQIRADAKKLVPQVSQIFVSSTHDESAPDPIGLWGPDGTGLPGNSMTQSALSSTALTSGVDNYYLSFLAHQAARAIAKAYHDLAPAELKLAYAGLPANVQECWSSYPFIADHMDPVMQAVNPQTQKVIFTLVNGNTHVETFAFAGVPADTTMFSADWAGKMRQDLAHRYGGVGVEMSGLVGSVETPALYPSGTLVTNVPGPYHGVNGAVDGCSSVYPNPTGAIPITSAHRFVSAYGQAMATSAETALASDASIYQPSQVHSLIGQQQGLCVPLESNFFTAAFAAGTFADRPAYVDPTCSVGASFNKVPAPAYHLPPGPVYGANPLWLKTNVGVLTIGPAQLAYVPGEMFPFTAMRGHIDATQMPFPTTCYNPTATSAGQFNCGAPLPMTPWITTDMTEPYRFVAGLGQDMIGYMMPPGGFVGSSSISENTPSGPNGVPPSMTANLPEVNQQPWLGYELTSTNWNDRFGYGHPDDSESIGPHAGLQVTSVLAGLLAQLASRRIGHPQPAVPGLYVDTAGHTSDSPFPASNPYAGRGPNASPVGFTGAIGVVAFGSNGRRTVYCVGNQGARPCQGSGVVHATAWATFDGTRDPGTAGTSLPYSVSTAGMMLPSGEAMLVDVYTGPGPLASSSPLSTGPAAPTLRVAPSVPTGSQSGSGL